MKKYSKPETKMITVATTKMIATSSVGFNSTAVDADKAQSRGNNSFWDDDEE